MSYALITAGGPDGRYTVYLDWGEAQKAALLAQVAAAQADLTAKIAEQQQHIDEADAIEAAALAQLRTVQEALIAEMQAGGGDGPDDSGKRLYDDLLARHRAVVIRHQPVRDAMKTLKSQLAQANAMAAYWDSFSASETRQAWCCDFTEDASGYVATLEIPGESGLILIAPGGRAWQGGDGTIAQSKKDAALAVLNGRLMIAEAEHVSLVAKLAAAAAQESTLKGALASAKATLEAANASGLPEAIANAQRAFDAATKALNDNRLTVAQLTLSVVGAVSRIAALNQQIAVWAAKPASVSPDYGDGVLSARELMSPEQAYFNAAILPGWQKHMPTYRWGTASNVNYDANTMDVILGEARSSAQRLDVNERAVLVGVPVSYMTCDADAFDEGDRVVVRFQGGDWGRPLVIGFSDTPKKCGAFPSTVTFVVRYSTQTAVTANASYWINLDNTACGMTAPVKYLPTTTAPSGAHSIDIVGAEAINQLIYPGATVACSVPPQTVWSGVSAAFGYTVPPWTSSSAGNVPSGEAQTLLVGDNAMPGDFVPGWDDRMVLVRSVSSEIATAAHPAGYGGFCQPFEDAFGNVVINEGKWAPPYGAPHVFTYADVIPMAWIDEFLLERGLMPTVSVSYGGRTRSFSYKGRQDISASNSGNATWEWRITFRKDD